MNRAEPAPGIAVAIATLDRPEALAACLDAVLDGHVTPAEVIVVDQSRDNRTESIVHERSRGPTPISYLRQRRRGLSASRNAAVTCSTQRVIAFTDDDCVPDPDWVCALEKAFASSSQLAAVTGRVLPLGPAVAGTHVVSPRFSASRAVVRGKHIPWLIGTGGNVAIKREWLQRIGCYDERLGAGSQGRAAEDADLFYRLLAAGATFRYEPDAIVYHRRQTLEQRLASRWGYGHGLGAFCALHLRRRDWYVLRICAYWLFSLLREFAGACAVGDRLGAYQRLLGLTGTVKGFWYGLRVRAAGSAGQLEVALE